MAAPMDEDQISAGGTGEPVPRKHLYLGIGMVGHNGVGFKTEGFFQKHYCFCFSANFAFFPLPPLTLRFLPCNMNFFDFVQQCLTSIS